MQFTLAPIISSGYFSARRFAGSRRFQQGRCCRGIKAWVVSWRQCVISSRNGTACVLIYECPGHAWLVLHVIVHGGDHAYGLIHLTFLSDTLSLISRQNLENSLAGGHDPADGALGVAGKLFGGFTRPRCCIADHCRLEFVESGEDKVRTPATVL